MLLSWKPNITSQLFTSTAADRKKETTLLKDKDKHAAYKSKCVFASVTQSVLCKAVRQCFTVVHCSLH